jgi:hypothetical protein
VSPYTPGRPPKSTVGVDMSPVIVGIEDDPTRLTRALRTLIRDIEVADARIAALKAVIEAHNAKCAAECSGPIRDCACRWCSRDYIIELPK